MTPSRGLRRTLITLGAVALIFTLVLLTAPLVVRALTLHYLHRAGVSATIGNVDVNLFMGHLAFDDVRGHGARGEGFEIGHLGLSLDYPPLFSRRLSLSELVLGDATVDVHRTADDALRVGGIDVLPSEPNDNSALGWGLALHRLRLNGLHVHYTQPGDADSSAIERDLILNDSNARDIVTWQDNDVPVEANMRVGDGRIGLSGQITPFGSGVTAHFVVTTENFAIDLLSPISRAGGLKTLTGTVDGHQQIDLDYTSDDGLTLTVKGKAAWQDSRLALADGVNVAGDDVDWQGMLKIHLPGIRAPETANEAQSSGYVHPLQMAGRLALSASPGDPSQQPPEAAKQKRDADDGPLALADTLPVSRIDAQPPDSGSEHTAHGPDHNGRITMDAHLQVAGLKISRPDGFSLSQKSGDWQGKIEVALAHAGTDIRTDSALTTKAFSFGYAGTAIHADALDWQGQTSIALDANKTAVDSNGNLKSRAMKIAVPSSIDLNADQLNFKGRTYATAGQAATQINTDGSLRADSMQATLAGDTDLHADQIDYDGTTDTHVETQATRVDSNGQLGATALSFAVPDSMTLDSDRLHFKGETRSIAADGSTRVDTDGALTASPLRFDVAGTSSFSSSNIGWQGTTRVDMGSLFSRQAHGRLTADGTRLDITGTMLNLSADRLRYDGDYSETPDAAGQALVLHMSGDLDSRAFTATNTAINAPWLAMLQAHVGGLTIDGLDSIRLEALTAHGVRMLGNTDSETAVLSSVTTEMKGFRLDDLARYQLTNLDIDGANIHVNRDASGMGAITRFFGNNGNDEQRASNGGQASVSPRYAIEHLTLTGPSVIFTDGAVTPRVEIHGSDLNFTLEDLDTARPDRSASYRLSLDVDAYGHLDSRGRISPLAPAGISMNLDAWLRSLALAPMSGYLNAAMGRRIAQGVADGTLHLEATGGQLDGKLDTTLGNFRLADSPHKETPIALGLSMDTALALVRGQNDTINFETAILGDVTNPYFSIKNLVREAVLAGLRTTLMSDYSPLGLLNKAKNAVVNIGRSLASRPALFEPGKHYIRPDDRAYLGHLAQAMLDKPAIVLVVRGHAVTADADAMPLFQGPHIDSDNRLDLQELATQRAQAVRDYLAARGVNADRIRLTESVVDDDEDARPQATFSLTGD